jgi:hypothetical protein
MVTYGRSLRTAYGRPTNGYGRPSHTSPHTPRGVRRPPSVRRDYGLALTPRVARNVRNVHFRSTETAFG